MWKKGRSVCVFHFELVRMSESGGGGDGFLCAGLTEVVRAKVRGTMVIRRGFACYGYGYHGEEREEEEEEKEKEDKKKIKKKKEKKGDN